MIGICSNIGILLKIRTNAYLESLAYIGKDLQFPIVKIKDETCMLTFAPRGLICISIKVGTSIKFILK